MGTRRSRALSGVVLALALVAGACGSKTSKTTGSGGGTSGTQSGNTTKVGILHPLSGTMAISEVSVRDAELLAIEEIDATGGVLGGRVRRQGLSSHPGIGDPSRGPAPGRADSFERGSHGRSGKLC